MPLAQLPNPAMDFIVGPQVPIGNTYFDQTQVRVAKFYGESCPEIPPTDDDGANSFVLLHYYDLALSEYTTYKRTNDPIFLTLARKCADSWWKQQSWIGEGKVRKWPDEAAPAPRHAGIAGLILRALDGRPEMWDWITSYTNYVFELYVGRDVSTRPLYDLREGAFMLHYATWLAKVLPDTFPLQAGGTATNGAVLRAKYLAGVETAAVQYFGRTQRADGAWTWNDAYVMDDGGSLVGVMQPFMVGLLLAALCDVHQLTTNTTVKENVKTQILKGCRHLYSDGPYIKDEIDLASGRNIRGFQYFYHGGTSVNPTRYVKGDMLFPWTDKEGWWLSSARQAISTILPPFAYAFLISGDEFYRLAYNEMYDSAYNGTDGARAFLDNTSKNFNQHIRRVPASLAWIGAMVTPPPVNTTPSPDGTKGIRIVDAQNSVWTFGPNKETLKNSIHVGAGFGSLYKYVSSFVYVLGTDNDWYKWTGTSWTNVEGEPGTTTTITISGRIMDIDGKPLPGARILLKTTGVGVYVKYTETDGTYKFDVPAAKYAIIPVASQFWVYQPCFKAVSSLTGNDFVATPSNRIVPQ